MDILATKWPHAPAQKGLEMAITPRKTVDGKRTSYLVRVEAIDPTTGKRKRKTVGTFRTKKEAEQKEREALVAKDRGTLLDRSTTTVGELLDSWLNSKRSQITSQSYVDYGVAIRKHLKPALGDIVVQKLTPARVQAQVADWQEQGMGPHVIRGCVMRLSQALDQAVEFNIVPRNVCSSVALPRVGGAKTDVWTPKDVAVFLRDATDDGLHPLWHLLALEGMRKGEALGLRWQDINWDREAAHISQTVVADKANGGKTIIQRRTMTATSARAVRLTPDTLAALRAFEARWRERKRAAADWKDNDLIVCTGHGTPISPRNVTRSFEALVLSTGLRRIRVHDLRHTAATMLLKAGVPPKIVSERLGHTRITITLDLHSHVLPDMQDEAAMAMSRLFADASA